jgi:hypothetical protein
MEAVVAATSAADLAAQLLPIAAQVGLSTGLTRCRQEVRLDTAITQGIGGRLHIAPDRGAGDDQYAHHHCCMLSPRRCQLLSVELDENVVGHGGGPRQSPG